MRDGAGAGCATGCAYAGGKRTSVSEPWRALFAEAAPTSAPSASVASTAVRGLRGRLPRRRVTTATRGPGCTRQAAAPRHLARHRDEAPPGSTSSRAAWCGEASSMSRGPRSSLTLGFGTYVADLVTRSNTEEEACWLAMCALCQLGTGTGQAPSGTETGSQLLHSRACWPRARQSRPPRSSGSCAASRRAAYRRRPPWPLRRGGAAARPGAAQHPAAASAGRSLRMGWAASSSSAVSRSSSVHRLHIELWGVPWPT